MILKVKMEPKESNGFKKWWYVDKVSKISVSKNLNTSPVDGEAKQFEDNDVELLSLLSCDCRPWKGESCGSDEEGHHHGFEGVHIDLGTGPGRGFDVLINRHNYQVVRVVARLEDGSEYSVLFDTTMYVLNDRGETVDRLVANKYKMMKKATKE